MLFNSYEFIFLFLPLTFAIYFYLNHKRLTEASNAFLICSSLFFYSWWNVVYLPIILVSTMFNYIVGRILADECKNKRKSFSKKIILIFGVIANLSLLGYFKYTDFLIENFNLAFDSKLESLHLVLPLAISFFTFQQIAYLVDSYRRETKEHSFLSYTLFVTFFPQLIAGPIVHHKEMMPQFSNVRNKVKNYKNISAGLFIFSLGLFKKVAIADTFSVWATNGFDTATTLNLFEAWATSLSYTFQLYFDFSGYADMAIGLALLFNIKLPINFNSPYKARSIQDFWKRWHITLSLFLRDYVYIPLGGNRNGHFRTYNNLLITFLIGGLWHGASWTFIFWGVLHGMALVIQKMWAILGVKLWGWLAWFITFNFVNITWIFFRANEWNDAIKVLGGMFSLENVVLNPVLQSKLSFLAEYGISFGPMFRSIDGSKSVVFALLLAFILVIAFSNSIQKLKEFEVNYKTLFVSSMSILLSLIVLLDSQSQFLYFDF